ncbi:MAG: class I SAM-dependent methyltransferase [Gemmatimonadaceae bacterium]|nr:class I SAM-dependent methyltransferase [Gemmatimonadaceae bacterium]
MSFWDQQFSTEHYKYGTAPNAFLVSQAARIAPGSRVLVPGDGEGRNGVWLAEQGHDVMSIDSSAVGLEKTQALARSRGVRVTTVHADLVEWEPVAASVDAVVSIYLHFPPDIRAKIHAKFIRALRPGGLFILEAFHPSHFGSSTFGPKDVTMLYSLDLLRADLTAFAATATGGAHEELLAEEVTVDLDEGPGHAGRSQVTRWVLRV